jgi:hypothetical protein
VGHEPDPEWIVRAVNVAPTDLVYTSTRLTQMEQYWREYASGETHGPGAHG